MQQTTQYKLNKPEADDPIAVAPLNENADKIEAALLAEAQARAAADQAEAQTRAAAHQAETQARASADNALAQRVTALEGRHIVMYTYTGDGSTDRFFPLGFTPTGGIYRNLSNNSLTMITPADVNQGPLNIVEGGFRVYGAAAQIYNSKGSTYHIIFFN